MKQNWRWKKQCYVRHFGLQIMWFNFLLLLCPPNVLLTTLPFLFSKTKLLEYLFPFKHFPPHILPFQRNKTLLFFLITTTHSYLLSQSLHSFNLLLWFPSIPLFLNANLSEKIVSTRVETGGIPSSMLDNFGCHSYSE